MNKLPFLQELVEARLFTDANTVKGKSVEDIAGIVYLMIMLLEIIRHEKHSFAADYANKTLAYNTYETMHYAGTDLGNLLAVLNNQDTFKGQVKPAKGIAIPLFAINRYLQSCKGSSFDHNEDATFFYRLEDYLKLYSNSVFRQLRRDVGDWKRLTHVERARIVLLLRREFDKRASSCDIYLWLKYDFKLKESVSRPQLAESTFMEEFYAKLLKEGRLTKDQLKGELFENKAQATAIDEFFALHKRTSLTPTVGKRYAPLALAVSGAGKVLIVYSTETEAELVSMLAGEDYKFKIGGVVRRFPNDVRVGTAVSDTFFYASAAEADMVKTTALLKLQFDGWKVEQHVYRDDNSDMTVAEDKRAGRPANEGKMTYSEPLQELAGSLIKPTSINTKLGYHNKLNPALWYDDELVPDVKEALGKIANKFSEFIDIKQIKIVDYIITGSNCAFNYTDESDIDIHVVVDSSKLGENPLTSPFLLAKKALWNSGHNITVKGYDVELYAEDVNNKDNKLVATGVYSLLQDRWIKKPEYVEVTYDDESVKIKAADIMNQIDELIATGEPDQTQIDKMWEHIYKMRRSGLAKSGEYGVENLTFKVVRNNDYLNKLREFERMREDEDLTLESKLDAVDCK